METKKSLYMAIMIFNLLFMAVAIVANIYAMIFVEIDAAFMRFSCVAGILALISAYVYVIKGAGKDSANYFKIFVYMFALSEFVYMIGSSNVSRFVCAYNAIAFSLILVIGLSKDLGKTKSYIFCGVIFVLRLISCINKIPDFFLCGDAVGLRTVGELAMASVLGVCMYAKYDDKKERYSKNQLG